SAQSTDATVNKVTETLFKKYRRPEDYLAAPPGELERDIYPTGFFNQKAKAIRGIAQLLVTEFGGEVPDTTEELLRLPGVARKDRTQARARGKAHGEEAGLGELLSEFPKLRARRAFQHPAVPETGDVEVERGQLRDAGADGGVVFAVQAERRSEPAEHVR